MVCLRDVVIAAAIGLSLQVSQRVRPPPSMDSSLFITLPQSGRMILPEEVCDLGPSSETIFISMIQSDCTFSHKRRSSPLPGSDSALLPCEPSTTFSSTSAGTLTSAGGLLRATARPGSSLCMGRARQGSSLCSRSSSQPQRRRGANLPTSRQSSRVLFLRLQLHCLRPSVESL